MHPPPYLFDAVARGEVSRELLDEIEREHLAALCPLCEETIAGHEARRGRPGAPALPGAPSRQPTRDRLDPLRRRLGLRELELRAREREARGWVRRAVKLHPDVRRDKVANAYVRYKGPLFCLLLLEEARRRIPGDPAEAQSLADAVLASNHKTAVYQPDPEVETPALAVRGNARRALGRLLAAESDLAKALRLLDSPHVTDPETPAEVFSYLGSLRKDQGRFDEAAHHLHRAATLYGLLRNQEKATRILLKLGAVHYARHEPGAAVTATENALRLLDPDSEAWLRGYAHYNLAFHLHAAGDTERAEAELADHEELLGACGEEVTQHLVWLRARIAWSREDLPAAQRLYTEARARALGRGIAWDAGLVSLELALVHLARGRTARVRTLAREALGTFAEQQVERETRAALDLLDAAARRDALTRELLEQAITAVERAAHCRPAAVNEPR
jgi:tetratricopeptide (TPR) repeat protein